MKTLTLTPIRGPAHRPSSGGSGETKKAEVLQRVRDTTSRIAEGRRRTSGGCQPPVRRTKQGHQHGHERGPVRATHDPELPRTAPATAKASGCTLEQRLSRALRAMGKAPEAPRANARRDRDKAKMMAGGQRPAGVLSTWDVNEGGPSPTERLPRRM